MLHYLRRARALAATVRRLEGEVRELREHLEHTRLETLAAEDRMRSHLDQVGKAAAGLFEYVRQVRAGEAVRPPSDLPPS